MDFIIEVYKAAAHNKVIQLVAIAVVIDTVFGCIRAVKEHSFNSCFGIDGAIRKISMVVSIVALILVDRVLSINLIGFIPESIRQYLGNCIGIAEFFGILYIAYEVVSILKNMALCGLPVKKVWNYVKQFLGRYTDELPDAEGMDNKIEITFKTESEDK